MKRHLKVLACCAALALALIAVFFPAEASSALGIQLDPSGVSGSFSIASAALVTVFTKDIEANLFSTDDFTNEAIDDSENAIISAGKFFATVSVPQAGAAPTVVRGAVNINQTVNLREDDNLDYQIVAHSTLPIAIQDADEMLVSYAKRQNLIQEHTDALKQSILDQTAYDWSPSVATQMIRTSGANVAATAPSATGTRKAFTLDDLVKAKTLVTKQKLPNSELTALMDPDMYEQLMLDPSVKNASAFGKAVLPEGVVDRIAGINIRVRSNVVIYTNASTPVKKAVGAAGAATDNLACLVYHRRKVRKAKTAVKVFLNPDQAQHYGTVISAQVFAGGSLSRKDQKGVVAIIQAAGV